MFNHVVNLSNISPRPVFFGQYLMIVADSDSDSEFEFCLCDQHVLNKVQPCLRLLQWLMEIKKAWLGISNIQHVNEYNLWKKWQFSLIVVTFRKIGL